MALFPAHLFRSRLASEECLLSGCLTDASVVPAIALQKELYWSFFSGPEMSD